MKICMVGSLLPTKVFDTLVEKSKAKPSNAPENFQMMFAKGLAQNKQEFTVISYPTVATFPNGPGLYLKKQRYTLDMGTDIRCPSLINLPLIKQAQIFVKTYFSLKKWFRENKGEKKQVILYSDYPVYATAARLACKKDKDANSVLFMTDLPTFSIMPHNKSLLSAMMCKMDEAREENYKKFDFYILLTKHMAEKMGVQEKPYIVVEGFSDPESYEFEQKKSEKKVLMYCGALSDVYNITTLLEAFQLSEIDAELWLFGGGTREKEVREAAEKDSRIKFFGKVTREELLHRQKEAHVLVSIKSSDDDFTKYAFPSKILEYMTAGTAVLSTKIGGIPDEYYEYIYTIENEDVKAISEKIEEILNLPIEELEEKGKKGQVFAVEKKNCQKQTKDIIDFLKG